MARASRPFVVAVVLTALLLTVSACGGVDSKTEVLRLRSANPVTSDLYVRVKGPTGAVKYIAQGLIRGAFSRRAEGLFVPPDVRRQEACSFSHTISVFDSRRLQAWRGKKLKITVYGNNSYAATYCRGIHVAGIFLSPS
jgi:hypothetical protein